jgi:hypothetical protein
MVPRKTIPLVGYYLASEFSRARMELCGGKRMQVTGIFVTTIESVDVWGSRRHEAHKSFDRALIKNIRRMATWMGLEGPFTHENEQFEAFYRSYPLIVSASRIVLLSQVSLPYSKPKRQYRKL